MLLNILKNDLRRKKPINLILFLFITIASMLIAGSGLVLYTTTTAISRMVQESNVPDMQILTYDTKETNEAITAWAEKSDKVESYSSEPTILIMLDSFLTNGSRIIDSKDIGSVTLSAVPKEYARVFDQNDSLLDLASGEIAIPMRFHQKYDINIGDKIQIETKEDRREFLVAAYTKDVTFGSELSSQRYLISDEDFDEYLSQETSDILRSRTWSVVAKDGVTFQEIGNEFINSKINITNLIGKDAIDQYYIVDKLVSMITIVVSVCLMIISFLILRFTITFTVQEDYRSIGIMKGLGLKNRPIRMVYLTKFAAISVAGGVVGFFLSFIYSGVMLQSSSEKFLARSNQSTLVVSILGALSVILTSMIFCYLCTRKINKVSVIEAIRRGNSGERFSKSRKVYLHKRGRLPASDFLAASDLLNGFRKFSILLITYVIGTLLIAVSLNMISTLGAQDSMMSLFGLPPFDVAAISDDVIAAMNAKDREAMETAVEKMEEKFDQKGYPVDFHVEIGKKANIYTTDEDQSLSADVMQGKNYDVRKYYYLEGTAPLLSNEIAVSSKVAEYFGVTVGDSITLNLDEKEQTFLITATYQSMTNSGTNVRVNESFYLASGNESMLTVYGSYLDPNFDQKQAIEEIKKAYPELSASTDTDLYDRYIGGAIKVVDSMKNLIVGVVVGILFFITCLITRILISREISEIALMKSLGFRTRQLRRWQILRIAIVLVLSVIIGTLISGPVSELLLNTIFGMMGVTKVPPVIEPLSVYLIYPAILLGCSVIAAAISIGQVKKTRVWEINNQE